MSDSLRLYHSISQQLDEFHPGERVTRRRNLALFMTGLFLANSVHLSHVVRKWPTEGKLPSLVNRLRRFLKNPRLDVPSLYQPVAETLLSPFLQGEPEAPLRLILDTTKIGFSHRLLTVSIAYKKRALPLAWSVHRGRKGHVSAAEQIRLLEQIRPLIETPSASPAVCVLGDSAFGTAQLISYLRERGWDFVLRTSGQPLVFTGELPWQRLTEMPLSEGQTRLIGPIRFTRKHELEGVELVMHWDEGEEEPWYLLTSREASLQTIHRYEVRMWTEELYGDLKGHGFDLEATQLLHAERLDRLMLGVCLTYVWLITLGSSVVKRGLRHLVDRKDRRDKSYFRIGWDYIERRLRLSKPPPIRFAPYI